MKICYRLLQKESERHQHTKVRRILENPGESWRCLWWNTKHVQTILVNPVRKEPASSSALFLLGQTIDTLHPSSQIIQTFTSTHSKNRCKWLQVLWKGCWLEKWWEMYQTIRVTSDNFSNYFHHIPMLSCSSPSTAEERRNVFLHCCSDRILLSLKSAWGPWIWPPKTPLASMVSLCASVTAWTARRSHCNWSGGDRCNLRHFKQHEEKLDKMRQFNKVPTKWSKSR